MDEEMINLTTEETVNIDAEEVVESKVLAEDLEQNIETEEVLEEIIDVEAVEEIEIEIDESIGWVGGDSTRHYSLYGRDEPNQHPITAITGLREELNDIEALGVVYSDKRNQADYYLWEDENVTQENRVGYFVSICPDINEIKMCTSDNNIFGVTVDSAGFIGAQDDIARDIKYGLVVTNGAVHVRCESSVKVGDYVISNEYGYARKYKTGYQVVGLHKIDGIDYAEIILATPINKICDLTDDVEDLGVRMDEAEHNIVAAMNVANEAYNKASEAGSVSEEAVKNALEALEKANDTSEKTDGFESRLEDINELATQAKYAAESAANSALTAKNEAVEAANNAFSETSKIRDELKTTADMMSEDLDDAVLNIEKLEEDLEPLAMWPDAENPTGIAGFVAQADENGATLAGLVVWKDGDGDDSLAGYVSKATSENAEIQVLASYGYIDDNGNRHYGAAGIMAEVDKNKSSIEAIVGKDGSIAGLQAEVDANKSAVDLVAKRVDGTYETVDTWYVADKDQNAVYYAEDTQSYWHYSDGVWKNTTDPSEAGLSPAIAGLQIQTDENSSSINQLTDWQGETEDHMASIEQKADDNGASIDLMVSSVDKYSVGEYSQSYGLTYEQAKNILKNGMIYIPVNHPDGATHSEGDGIKVEVHESDIISFSINDRNVFLDNKQKSYDYWMYYNDDGDNICTKIDAGLIYVIDNKPYYIPKGTYEFTEGNYYEWQSEEFGDQYTKSGWIEHSNSVYFSKEVPDGSDKYKYWYINSNEPPTGYDAHTLYIWKESKTEVDSFYWEKVNTLAGNVNNRVTSMIRQTADGVALEVTNARGSAATLGARITDTESEVQSLALWSKGGDENGEQYNLATIKQIADDAGASVAQVAAQICGEYITIEGTWDETGKDTNKVYYTKENKKYWYYKDGVWNSTDYPTEAGLQVNAASIVTAINNQDKDSVIKLNADVVNITADNIVLEGYVTVESLQGKGMTVIDGSNITTGSIQSSNYVANTSGVKLDLDNGIWDSANFKINTEGNITATGGTIGNWNIANSGLYSVDGEKGCGIWSYGKMANNDNSGYVAIHVGHNTDAINSSPFMVYYDGRMIASKGSIGGWNIDSEWLYSTYLHHNTVPEGVDENTPSIGFSPSGGIVAKSKIAEQLTFQLKPSGNIYSWDNNGDAVFKIENGNASFKGHIDATSGSFSGTLNAAGGSFSGTLNAGTIIMGNWRSGTLNVELVGKTETVTGIKTDAGYIIGDYGSQYVIMGRNDENGKFTGFVVGPKSIALYCSGQQKDTWS